jgi:chorismate mutase
MTSTGASSRDPREELIECRNAIEVVDRRLVALLAQRVALGRRAARAKRAAGLPMVDPAREAEVIRAALGAAAESELPAEPVREIFERIIELSRRVQESAR